MKKSITILLLAWGLMNCATYNSNQYPLHSAASLGDTVQVKNLIKSGSSIETMDQVGFTPLMAAIHYGQPETARALIEMGADVNATDHGGMTPLLYAVYGRQEGLVSLLTARGADTDARNSGGITPLMLAASYQYFEIVQLLADRGGNINIQDSTGMTPLLYAISACNSDGALFLLDRGAKADARGKNGESAIHYMVYGCSDSPEKASVILDKLIESGCDISAVDKDGHSAYWKAMEYRLVDMVALLRKKGVAERFGGGSPIELQKMAAEDCTYIVDGERSAGIHTWFIAGPISYGVAKLADSIKVPKKYQECMEKMGFTTIEQSH